MSEIDLLTVAVNKTAANGQTLKDEAVAEFEKLKEDANKVTQHKRAQSGGGAGEGGGQNELPEGGEDTGEEGGGDQDNEEPDDNDVIEDNNDQNDNEDDENDDERLEENFVEYSRCSIGIIHFPNQEFKLTKLLQNINKETSPQDLAQKIEDDTNEVLKNRQNMSFQIFTNHVLSRSGQNSIAYTITNKTKFDDNSSTLELCYPTKRDGFFLRLSGVASQRNSIVVKANEDSTITSDDFFRMDPFKDIFSENLPLIVTAVNAGPTNSYFSGIGMSSSLGIIEKNGRVRDAVTIYMRPAQKERFLLYFYTPYLYEKFFEMPTLLYFHFVIEPLY